MGGVNKIKKKNKRKKQGIDGQVAHEQVCLCVLGRTAVCLGGGWGGGGGGRRWDRGAKMVGKGEKEKKMRVYAHTHNLRVCVCVCVCV